MLRTAKKWSKKIPQVMPGYIVKCCDDCDSVKQTLNQLDEKISGLTDNNYQNRIYLLSRPFDIRQLKTLLYYKKILLNLYWNLKYYPNYDYKKIVAKVKTLI